jgi:hypothetical protein
VVLPNVRGLHLEDGQIIDATRATASLALQSRCVQHVQPACLASDVRVQRDDGIGFAGADTDLALWHGTHHSKRARANHLSTPRRAPIYGFARAS